MLEHAFGTLGLHRVGLAVFAFNERAIRSYRKVGFVVEGRSREAIWRDGRFFDEIHMSVLADEWQAIRGRVLGLGPAGSAAGAAGASPGPRAGAAASPIAAAQPAGRRGRGMTSTGPAAEAARAAFRAHLDAKGHAVENARAAAAELEAALAAGALTRTPALDRMLADLAVALDADLDAGEKLGAKSAEAARFILRAISRELDQA